MNLNDRFSVLKQGAMIAQSKGVLSLEDAVYVKSAIDNFKDNLDVSTKILIKTIQIAQSKGAYTLKDAYLLYVALNGIENEIKQYMEHNKYVVENVSGLGNVNDKPDNKEEIKEEVVEEE